MMTLAPRPRLREHRRAGGSGKVRDLIDLAVLRVRQDPGGFDPAELFRELDREHRVELIRIIIAVRPKGWAAGTGGAARFARHVCELAEALAP